MNPSDLAAQLRLANAFEALASTPVATDGAEPSRPSLADVLRRYGTSTEKSVEQLGSVDELADAVQRGVTQYAELFFSTWSGPGTVGPLLAWYQWFWDPIIGPDEPTPPRLRKRRDLSMPERNALAELEALMAWIGKVYRWWKENGAKPGDIRESTKRLRQFIDPKGESADAGKKARRRGPKPLYDPEKDARLYADFESTDVYPSVKDFAQLRGVNAADVERTVKRHRRRTNSPVNGN